jgi:Mg2+/Co2+ transporter CorB
LQPLLKLFHPIVTIVNSISNQIISLLGINPQENQKEELSADELKSILQYSGVPDRQLQMLVSIFDMDHLSVNDVMIPKNQLIGINISEEMTSILKILRENQYDNLPVYEETLDNLKGILTLEGAANFLIQEPAKENLINCLQELKFIPENTPLHTQLLNFQNEKRLVGTVVDEYGDIQGMITRKAILEEIVGKLTSDTKENLNILPQQNEEFIINGNTNIREVNKKLGWDLPTDGPKTISGLILETAQSIPENNVGIKILNYNFETILIKDNVVKMAKAKKIPLTEKLKEEEDE